MDMVNHILFLTVDKILRRFDINFEVGPGYRAPEDKRVKAIVGTPIDTRQRSS